MDTHVKTGQVYLQPQKAGKKWKKFWLALYPSSRRGVARLELQEMGGGESAVWPGGAWKPQDRRIIRLSECVSIRRLPPHAEACPKDNLAFCVETDDRTFVFAADKDDCVEWVEKMCDIAFQSGSGSTAQQHLQMEENEIYVSREEVSEFRVNVQQTDASTRCGLQGAYWLQVGRDGLVLKEAETRRSLQGWPYQLLRRYGRDQFTFSIEAGRRCDSGPGTFTFETGRPDDVFGLIEAAIRDQKAPAIAGDDGEGDTLTTKPRSARPHSPLPKLPIGLDFNNRLVPESPSTSGSEECVYSVPADSIKPKAPGFTSHQPPPRPSLCLPSDSHHGDRSEPVYADPVDYIRLTPPDPGECVYSDPADTLKPQTSAPDTSSLGRHDNHPEPVYSEVYKRATPVQTRQDQGEERFKEEPVYSEPFGGGRPSPTQGQSSPGNPEGPKTDAFSHLYAQVCKTTQSASKKPTAGHHSPEVIYENLGVI